MSLGSPKGKRSPDLAPSSTRAAYGFKKVSTIREDSRGRVALGARPHKPDAYQVFTNDQGEILLVPVREVPEAELWLWQNPAAMATVRAGLADSAAGRVTPFDMNQLAGLLEEGDTAE